MDNIYCGPLKRRLDSNFIVIEVFLILDSKLIICGTCRNRQTGIFALNLGGPVWSQELNSMFAVGLFQVGIFSGHMILSNFKLHH